MKQQSFFKPSRKEHGGALSVSCRRSRRPLSTKMPLHVTLRSDFAFGRKSLLKHQSLINHIGKKFSRRFGVKIYRQAICGNHIHLVIRGTNREGLQNFFRVFAGHVAQQILSSVPILMSERSKVRGGAPADFALNPAQMKRRHSKPVVSRPGCLKNQRKFWALLTYTRVLSWGREFKTVCSYILKNTLEALLIIAYRPRRKSTSIGYKLRAGLSRTG